MWNEKNGDWDHLVEAISRGYDSWPCYTPEGVMERYHKTNKALADVRKRLENPVSLKGGAQLKPSTIHQFEKEEKALIRLSSGYEKFIKKLVKYNLLPVSKLIEGTDGRQFVFSLQTMIELPELGKAVYYSNRLLYSRYESYRTPSTNEDYVKLAQEPGHSPRKKEEQSRESMYNALLASLDETINRIKRERERLLFSGTPRRLREAEANNAGNSCCPYANQENVEKAQEEREGGDWIDEYLSGPADDILCAAKVILESDNEGARRAVTGTIMALAKNVSKGCDTHEQIQSAAAPEQADKPTDQASRPRNATRDTFVNLNMLYEQLADPLRQLAIDLYWAKAWLGPTYIDESPWMPAYVKCHIESSQKESEKCIKAVKKIQNILLNFKKDGSQKLTGATSMNTRARISHMNVIKGGQHIPAVPRIKNTSLGVDFIAFLEKQRGGEAPINGEPAQEPH